jgi:hypothetical protein
MSAPGSEVEYLFSTGIDEVIASANVEIATTAGAEPGYVIYDFVWDPGRTAWKIDSAFAPGGPAPDPNPDPDPSS